MVGRGSPARARQDSQDNVTQKAQESRPAARAEAGGGVELPEARTSRLCQDPW